jgi:hypothetical protein
MMMMMMMMMKTREGDWRVKQGTKERGGKGVVASGDDGYDV